MLAQSYIPTQNKEQKRESRQKSPIRREANSRTGKCAAMFEKTRALEIKMEEKSHD